MASEKNVPPLFVETTKELREWIEAAREVLAAREGNPGKLQIAATVRRLITRGLEADDIPKPTATE